MLRVVDAELRRLVRRWSYWILTAVVIAVVAVFAWHNVGRLRSANDIYKQSVAAVERCAEDGGAACPQVSPSSAIGPSTATRRDSQQAQEVTPRNVMEENVAEARRNLEATLSAMSPSNWPRLGLVSLATAPGAFLALALGAIVVGGDYTLGTWKTQLLSGVSRRKLLIGKSVALATAMAGWVIVAYTLSPIMYALLARGVIAPTGWPPIPVEALLGAWLSLSVFAYIGVLLSVVTRSSIGGLAGSGVVVTALIALGALSTTHLLFIPGSSTPTGLPRLQVPVGLALLPAAHSLVAPAIAVAEWTPIASGVGAAGPSLSSTTASTVLVAWLFALVIGAIAVFDRQEVQ